MTDSLRQRALIRAEDLFALLQQTIKPVILAVRSADTTAPRPFEQHPRIPGAQDSELGLHFASPSHPQHGSRPLPAIAALQQHARDFGISPGVPVVVYDHDGGLQAARAWWVLKWAGVEPVRLLDGGFQAWQRAGLPVSLEVPPCPAPGNISLTTGRLPVFGADEALVFAQHGVLLDSRIHPNYCGDAAVPARGHIPGARSVPAPDNLAADGRFADTAALRALYTQQGADGSLPVGVYCGAGVSAAHDILALYTLGVNAALYPGSWSAWISDPTRPVATGPEPG